MILSLPSVVYADDIIPSDGIIAFEDVTEAVYNSYIKPFNAAVDFSTWVADVVESSVASFVATGQTMFNDIVDAVSISPVDFFGIKVDILNHTTTAIPKDEFYVLTRSKFTSQDNIYNIGSGSWVKVPFSFSITGEFVGSPETHSVYDSYYYNGSPFYEVYATVYGARPSVEGFARGLVICAYTGGVQPSTSGNNYGLGRQYIPGGWYTYVQKNNVAYGITSFPVSSSQYSSYSDACADFFGNEPIGSEPVPNGLGYTRSADLPVSVGFPAITRTDWQGVSDTFYNNYGDDYETVNNVDYSIYNTSTPIVVNYDYPAHLYDGDYNNIWETLPSVNIDLPVIELDNGDGSFWQVLFESLPVKIALLLLGVLLCYLIFLML